jgi:hypothetical protein
VNLDEFLELVPDTFRSRVRVEPNGCAVWLGSIQRAGHGQYQRPGGRLMKAHRFAFEVAFGEISNGFVVHHTCGEPSCVNPDHLSAMNPSEHTRLHARKAARRSPLARRGELFFVLVTNGWTPAEIADRLGLTRQAVTRAIWRWQREPSARDVLERQCAFCELPIAPTRTLRARFCSGKCRAAWHRSR